MKTSSCPGGGGSLPCLLAVLLLMGSGAILHLAAQEAAQAPAADPAAVPGELSFLLEEYDGKLRDGTSRLLESYLPKLAQLKEVYVKRDQLANALAVERTIVSFQEQIAALRQPSTPTTADATAPASASSIRQRLTEGVWIRDGKSGNIGKSFYRFTKDGSAEGRIGTATGALSAWNHWELRGTTLRVGPAAGGGESFEYDKATGTFVGPLSVLKAEEAPAP